MDRSFVLNVPGNSGDATITSTIIALAHALNLQVVAEGVEDEKQAAFLVENGCHVMQGYLYSMPVPPEGIRGLVASGLPEALRQQAA